MGECFGFFLDFFMGIFLGGFFQRIFLEGILCLYSQSQLTYLNLKGIDAFVKILSQGKEERKFQFLEVQVQAYST